MLFILYKNIRLKGALTEKSYNFTFRPWETAKNLSVDITDGSNLGIQVFLKNNEVLRVLATSNVSLNEEWLTDKSKYVYDSLYINRISANSIKYSYSSNILFSKITLLENKILLNLLKNLFKSYQEHFFNKMFSHQLFLKISDNDDLHTIISSFEYLPNTTTNVGSPLQLTNFYKAKNMDFLFNTASGVVLNFVVPKLEAWILNYKLVNISRKKNFLILGLNNWFDFSYKYKNLGLTNFTLNKLLLSKYSCSKRLIVKNSNILYFFGPQALNSFNNKFVFNTLNLLKDFLKINQCNLNLFLIPSNFNSYYLDKQSIYDQKKFKKLNIFNDLMTRTKKNFCFTTNILYYSQYPYQNDNLKDSFIYLKKYSILESKLI